MSQMTEIVINTVSWLATENWKLENEGMEADLYFGNVFIASF